MRLPKNVTHIFSLDVNKLTLYGEFKSPLIHHIHQQQNTISEQSRLDLRSYNKLCEKV